MNIKAYEDGKASVRDATGVSAAKLRRAIGDCREMGWYYLEDYFRGKLDAVQDKGAR